MSPGENELLRFQQWEEEAEGLQGLQEGRRLWCTSWSQWQALHSYLVVLLVRVGGYVLYSPQTKKVIKITDLAVALFNEEVSLNEGDGVWSVKAIDMVLMYA